MNILHLGGSRLGDRILEVLQRHGHDPKTVDTLDDARALLADRPDWIVSAGFRHILASEDLTLAGDSVNVHTSLLPYGRGANPNVWSIVDHEPAGATLHRMVPAVDAGPVWDQYEVPTTFGDTAATVYRRVEDAAVLLFAIRWPDIRDGKIAPDPQPTGGSHHYARQMHELADIDLEGTVTWRQALDTLRALTFPPHDNIVVEEDGRRWSVRLDVREV